jgi:hypothetical protein
MADNGALISGLYASFAKGDVPAVLGALDQKVEWREADGFPYAGTYNGPDAVLNGVFMPLGTEWDGFTVTPDEIVVSGDRVIAMGYYAGTYKATGKSFRAQFAHAWRLADGKVVNFQQYVDTALVQEAIRA